MSKRPDLRKRKGNFSLPVYNTSPYPLSIRDIGKEGGGKRNGRETGQIVVYICKGGQTGQNNNE